MRICYVFPSRERPSKFARGIENIQDMSASDDYLILAKLDLNDPTRKEYETCLKEFPEVIVKWGKSNNKIHACNRGLEELPECDILVLFSDDMKFLVFGYDDQIRESFAKHFPELDGVVHYPDSHALDRTMTLTMMGVNLYKQLGYLYHPSFESVYADNHITELSRKMGKYVFINKKIFDHFHPIWNMTAWDKQYRRTESQDVYKRDRDTFDKHKANNFGL